MIYGRSGGNPFIIRAKAGFFNFAPTTNGAQFWLTYKASGGDYRSPIPTIVYVSITNQQDIPSLIENISLKAKTDNCDWFDLLSIDPGAGRFSFASPDRMRGATIIDMESESLSKRLLDHPIAPHDSVNGWMLFDTKAECQTEVGQPITLKIAVKDAAGVSFESLDSKYVSSR